MIARFEDEYRFLSNFAPSLVVMYGDFYPTNEHAFHAAKWPPVVGQAERSRINAQMRTRIQQAPTPGIAKQLGQQRRPPIRGDWETFRLEAMLLLLRRKFGGEPMGHPAHDADARLRGGRLLETGDETLVEGNGWGDVFWGAVWTPRGQVGRDDTVWASAESGDVLVGENHLGRLLAQVRRELGAA